MAETNFFSKNIRYLREKHGVEQVELANHLGRKSGSSISDWEKGKYTPKAGTLNKIAQYFHISLSELMETDLSDHIPNIREIGEFISIPIIGTIACGDPITAEENIEGYKERSKNDLPGGELFYLTAQGDSMQPTIPNGSLVLCRRQADVENGEIAAVLVNGDEETTLKKVRKINGMIMLEPLNDQYEPFFITKDNPARIVGKAVEVTAKL